MPVPQPAVKPETEVSKLSASAGIHVGVLAFVMAVKLTSVFVHFILGVHVFEVPSVVPPVLVGLHENRVWLQFFDQLLSPLGKHRALVASSNKEDLPITEPFGHVQKRSLEDAIAVTNPNTLIA